MSSKPLSTFYANGIPLLFDSVKKTLFSYNDIIKNDKDFDKLDE